MSSMCPKQKSSEKFFSLPNELFALGLSTGAISVYSYLLYIENRNTFKCWPSYATIGRAVGMSRNTVSKYVAELESKGLIRTEPTQVRRSDGRKMNGNLLYSIRPIREAVELINGRLLDNAKEVLRQKQIVKRAAEEGLPL